MMFAWISCHPILATIAIGAGTVAASEIIWAMFKYGRDKINEYNAQIHEIIMFNELGHTCVFEHRKHSFDSAKFQCPNVYCAERSIGRIIAQIDKAKYSIDLAMYSLNSFELFEALKRAVHRGVQMRIIYQADSSQITELVNLGVPVLTQLSKKLMHHKFCLIDERKRVDKIWKLKRSRLTKQITYSVLINGSLNWTNNGVNANWENCVICSDEKSMRKLHQEFARMWKTFGNMTVLQLEK